MSYSLIYVPALHGCNPAQLLPQIVCQHVSWMHCIGDIIPRLWAMQATPAEAEAVAQQLQASDVDTDSVPSFNAASSPTATAADASPSSSPTASQPWWRRRQPPGPQAASDNAAQLSLETADENGSDFSQQMEALGGPSAGQLETGAW